MNPQAILPILLAALALGATAARAQAVVGSPAPDFTLSDTK